MDDMYILRMPGHEESLFWKTMLYLKIFVLIDVEESGEEWKDLREAS